MKLTSHVKQTQIIHLRTWWTKNTSTLTATFLGGCPFSGTACYCRQKCLLLTVNALGPRSVHTGSKPWALLTSGTRAESPSWGEWNKPSPCLCKGAADTQTSSKQMGRGNGFWDGQGLGSREGPAAWTLRGRGRRLYAVERARRFWRWACRQAAGLEHPGQGPHWSRSRPGCGVLWAHRKGSPLDRRH